MPLSQFLQSPVQMGHADYMRQAVQDVQNQQLANMKLKEAAAEQENKRRSLAISMLNGIANEPDQMKQAELYTRLKPMAERYDPTLKLPDQYDPSLTRALSASQLDPSVFLKQQQPNLPTGYQMNPQTGQAELIPGVDPSYGRKADPYSMPIPVTTPDGKNIFATRQEVANNPTAYAPPTPQKNTFNQENSLRDEFNTLTKDFRTVQDAYTKIGSTSDTGAGDMSMLYAYVKLLDPGSVVRESEFASAAASGSFGERVQGAVKSITSGGRLPPSLRREFLDEAGRIYNGQKAGYDRLKQTYTQRANQYQLSPENIITDYAAPAPQSAEPRLAPDGNYYIPDPNRPGKYLMVQP